MQKRNNLLVIHAVVLLMFLCTILLHWFTLNNTPNTLSVTGTNGTLELFCRFPIWLLVVFSMVATGISAMNTAGFTTISRWVPVLILLFSGSHYVRPILTAVFSASDRLVIGVGSSIAILSSIVALLLAFTRPSRNSNA